MIISPGMFVRTLSMLYEQATSRSPDGIQYTGPAGWGTTGSRGMLAIRRVSTGEHTAWIECELSQYESGWFRESVLNDVNASNKNRAPITPGDLVKCVRSERQFRKQPIANDPDSWSERWMQRDSVGTCLSIVSDVNIPCLRWAFILCDDNVGWLEEPSLTIA